MKRLISVLLLLCLSVAVGSAAFADTEKLSFAELALTLSVPEAAAVFTRDVMEDDPNLATFQQTRDNLLRLFITNNIYLNVVMTDPYAEILLAQQVTEASEGVFDFNLLSEQELRQSADSIINGTTSAEPPSTEAEPLILENYTTYRHPQMVFLKFTGAQMQDDEPTYITQYYTIFNGGMVSLTLRTFGYRPTADQDLMLIEMVDSMNFSQVLSRPEPPADNILGLPTFWYRFVIGAVIGMILATLLFWLIRTLSRRRSKKHIKVLSEHTGRSASAAGPAAPTPSHSVSLYRDAGSSPQLVRLYQMHRSGKISTAEYEACLLALSRQRHDGQCPDDNE